MSTFIALDGSFQFTLIKELIDQLKSGRTLDIYLLKDLMSLGLLTAQKQSILELINHFIQWCEEEIFAENDNAMYLLGYFKENGLLGFPKDLIQAIDLYEQASHLGNTDAISARGNLYQHDRYHAHKDPYKGNGRGFMSLNEIESNFKAAVILYEKAMASDNVQAIRHCAYLYEHGINGPIDLNKAISLYDKAIRLGCSRAMIERAKMYEFGKGSSVDYDKAIALYEHAILLGNPTAMNCRADLHFRGEGGPIDFDKVISLNKNAAQRGSCLAMYSLAFMCRRGQGSPVDWTTAARYFRLAADNQCSVGEIGLRKKEIHVIHYHELMHQKELEKCAQLILLHPFLIEEFFTYDVAQNPPEALKKLQHMHNIIDQTIAHTPKQPIVDQYYFSVLERLDIYGKQQGNCSTRILPCKKDLLKRILTSNLNQGSLIIAMEIAINAWYEFTSIEKNSRLFTREIAHFLSRGLSTLIDIDQVENCQDLIANIVVILGKNLYGDNYKLSHRYFEVPLKEVQAMMASCLADYDKPLIDNKHTFFKTTCNQPSADTALSLKGEKAASLH
ncbi:MAG: sel1 repeat family protein [Legionella sp.]|nr:sel1 repeat family protein [Legionella sp.]